MLDLSSGFVALPPRRTDPLAHLRRCLHDIDPKIPKEAATFAAALILLAGCEFGHNVARLARLSGYPLSFVARCARRLYDNGVWANGRTIAGWIPGVANEAFWLDVAVAEGRMCRRTCPHGEFEWAPPGEWWKSYDFFDSEAMVGAAVTYRPRSPESHEEETAEEAPFYVAAEVAVAEAPDEEGFDLIKGGWQSGDDRTTAAPGASLPNLFPDAVWLR